ncbi:hypothetical protein QYM36_018319 [Artemia franciscana]|uniref:Uncharacterized protein n=1 Tax=Artemia franciscana TaxID=6661 RepID=A0AA88H2R2_ARTSF|nr:hypothetical protein QYM36_018319 [Artemia franciscana]
MRKTPRQIVDDRVLCTKIYADDTLIDEFYDNSQSVIDSIPLHDLTCIAVDLKAKVGPDRSYCLGVMGQRGLGTITKNGAPLFSFTKGNDLLISGELFQHKDINTYTWTSRKGIVKNQIDHFLIHHPDGARLFAIQMANKPKRRSKLPKCLRWFRPQTSSHHTQIEPEV